MRDLSFNDVENVSGGPGWFAVVAAVMLAAEVIDVGYNAGKAFKEGYDANNKV